MQMKNTNKHQILTWWKSLSNDIKSEVTNFYQVSSWKQMTTSQIVDYYEKLNKRGK